MLKSRRCAWRCGGLFALCALLVGHGFAAETNGAPVGKIELRGSKPSPEMVRQILYRDLINVKYVYAITLQFDGTAEELGIDQGLSDFLTLKFKNTFTGYELRPFPKDAKWYRDAQGNGQYIGLDKNEWAYVNFRIWTVSQKQTVAYHIRLEIKRLLGGDSYYQNEVLDLTSARELTQTRLLKDTLSDMMERAATEIMKLQGKL